MINRKLQKIIIEKLRNYDKSILLYGTRQVGKTTLVKNIISELGYKTLSINFPRPHGRSFKFGVYKDIFPDFPNQSR